MGIVKVITVVCSINAAPQGCLESESWVDLEGQNITKVCEKLHKEYTDSAKVDKNYLKEFRCLFVR